MRTDKDFAKHCAIFVGELALGALLFILISCATLRGAGEGLKEDAGWLPAPWGAIAESAGTVALLFAGHKTVRHVRKRSKKRALAKALAPKH